jgi:hypothetical protein
VRTDLPEPKHVSMANVQNFGNEPSTMCLLSPCSTADRGVNETHYLRRQSKVEIQELLDAAGIAVPAAEFDACFEASVRAEGEQERTSLKCFMEMRHAMLHQQAGL